MTFGKPASAIAIEAREVEAACLAEESSRLVEGLLLLEPGETPGALPNLV